jgi:F0F1-type ATP synthase epsilon subunit
MEPKDIAVELHTGHGLVFIGDSSSVEMRTDDGTVLLIPTGNTYMSMLQLSTITLRCGEDFKRFNLKNATAGLHGRRLTVLAEEILSVATPSP